MDDVLIGAVALGLAYGFLAMGIFITMRIFNFPDITADGSLALGGAITAAITSAGGDAWIATGVATLAGAAAGSITGVIHTKLRVNGLLAGILVMTALYSVNLRIMGRSNIPLISTPNILNPFRNIAPGLDQQTSAMFLLVPLAIAVLAVLTWFFRTDLGLAMRATGDNETMIAAQGTNVDGMKIGGIALSNAAIALSGSIVAQYQGYADIGMGIGTIVFGLASVIIGDALSALLGDRFRIGIRLGAVIIGSILFRILVGITLSLGLDPVDLKLVTSVFVLIAIVFPTLFGSPHRTPHNSY